MSINVEILEKSGQKVALVLLNKPKKLNSIDTHMYKVMKQHLEQLKTDELLSAVVFHSDIPKAFCAGGDVKGLVLGNDKQVAYDFFTEEYCFDLYLRDYPVPTITWGEGMVIGGGFGVFMSTDIRITTPTSRFMMPETKIGLFPDVGASHFLNLAPLAVKRFMAFTSAFLGGAEAYSYGLSNLFVEEEKWQVFETLFALPKLPKGELLKELKAKHGTEPQEGLSLQKQLQPFETSICKASNIFELEDALHNISLDIEGGLDKSLEAFKYASPLSKMITFEQLKRGEDLSVAQAFHMEWNLALNCYMKGDFKEGVRALLIDKDMSPVWQHKDISEVGDVTEYFNQPQELINPISC